VKLNVEALPTMTFESVLELALISGEDRDAFWLLTGVIAVKTPEKEPYRRLNELLCSAANAEPRANYKLAYQTVWAMRDHLKAESKS
jgi:hypothetical protein